MRISRSLVLVLLVYVGLDLSSPAIPGAFVFEPSESVETVSRGQTPSAALPAPVSVADRSRIAAAGLADRPQPASARIVRVVAAPRRPPVRTALEPPPALEEPH